MKQRFNVKPPQLGAVGLLHQEGIFGVVALIGMALRGRRPLEALSFAGPWWQAIAAGICAALACVFLWRLLVFLPAVRDLESWQAALVRTWSDGDVVAVAVLSGVCEEALVRAMLQPWIGLIPAAAIFGVLHVIPDRRLWLWPVTAFSIGLVFGLLYETWGYPSAAVSHVVLNLVSLRRLKSLGDSEE